MHLMYFTEQPMSAYPAQAGLDFGATALMFSNKHFDPAAGSRRPGRSRAGGWSGPAATACLR